MRADLSNASGEGKEDLVGFGSPMPSIRKPSCSEGAHGGLAYPGVSGSLSMPAWDTQSLGDWGSSFSK